MKPFPSDLRKVVYRLLEDLGTPRALTVKTMMKYEEWDQLVSLRADPACYLTPESYYSDAIATELLRKCADLPTKVDRRAEALAGFHIAEWQCAETNARLNPHIVGGPFESPSDMRISGIFRDVKEWISGCLGPLPKDLDARFGPGATLKDIGRKTTLPDKMSSQPTVTRAAEAFQPLWRDTAWCRALCSDHPNRSAPLIVRGNRFTTVPKDATKDRGIAIEPSLNIYYQLGVGSCIRQRLANYGINLEEGQTIHRRVAREASQNGQFATIDLSSASDTISRALVKLVIPEHWYDLLNALRSPTTLVDGQIVFLNKFSSMGNGYTFELETLIFLGLAAIAMRQSGLEPLPGHNLFVYGDDIIVPICAVQNLQSLFEFCGLTLNSRKSFTSGPFRESCGGDFFDGVYVRPHYLKEYPYDPQTWIGLANGLRRMAVEHSHSGGNLRIAQRAWFCALDNLPSPIRRLRGPSSLGDLLIHDCEERWSYRVRNSIRLFRVWRPVTRGIPLSKWSPLVQLACALYGVPSTGPILRGSVSGYKVGYVAYS